MAAPAGVKLPSFRGHFVRSFVQVLVFSVLCTLATWGVSFYLLIGDFSLLQPADYYERQIPDVVRFANAHADRILTPEFQGELETVIPLAGLGYQVLGPDGRLVYGSEREQHVDGPLELVEKLNTSEVVAGRIVTYHPVVDAEGNWLATLVLTYRLALSSSNPDRPALVLVFAAVNMLAPFVYIIVFTALIARRMSRRLEEPINRLIAAADKIRERNLDFTLEAVGGSRELVKLGEAVEDMRSALQHALTAQWQMEQERREMLANLAHDLETPLTVIAGHVDNLIEGKAKREERLERYLATLRTYTERAIQLVNDMRILAEVDHPALTLELAPFDAPRFFADVRGTFQTRCTEKQIHFETSLVIEPDAATVRVDARRLEQILTNIVENSLRYTPAGGMIVLNARVGTDGLQIDLTDTGPGFAEKDLPHVLERFYQGDPSRSGHTGMGLGLHIVKTLTERHGGRVEVGNRPEGGARVHITIPAKNKGNEM